MPNELHPFAEAVIEARMRLGLTQRELSELARVSQSSISDIERGKIKLFNRLGNFQKVLAVFGLELIIVENGLTEEELAAIKAARRVT